MILRNHLSIFIGSLLLLMTLASCSTQSSVSTVPVHEHDWGFMKFAEVRAFQINWNDQNATTPLLGARGKLNETRHPKNGVVLNAPQIAKLKSAVTGTHPDIQPARCFYPHHAFIFYDSEGGVVGVIDVCFLCQRWQPTVGFADHCDFNTLEGLVQDLGMPLTNSAWPMVRLWQRTSADGG